MATDCHYNRRVLISLYRQVEHDGLDNSERACQKCLSISEQMFSKMNQDKAAFSFILIKGL